MECFNLPDHNSQVIDHRSGGNGISVEKMGSIISPVIAPNHNLMASSDSLSKTEDRLSSSQLKSSTTNSSSTGKRAALLSPPFLPHSSADPLKVGSDEEFVAIRMKVESVSGDSQCHEENMLAHQMAQQNSLKESMAGNTGDDVDQCCNEEGGEPLHHMTEPAFNIASYEIPVKNFPIRLQQGLKATLHKNESLPLSLRRLLVRIVSNDLHLKVVQPGRSMLREVAKKLIRLYPVLQDVVDTSGTVIGTGYTTLVTSLEYRFENLNRHLRCKKRKRNKERETQHMCKKRKVYSKESYGCSNFDPAISPEQLLKLSTMLSTLKENYGRTKNSLGITAIVREEMKTVYPIVRYKIVSKLPISALVEEIPYLLDKNCFLDHFTMLTNSQLLECKSFFEAKLTRVMKFVQKYPRVSSHAVNCGLPAVDLFNCLGLYLGDDPQLLCLQNHEINRSTTRKLINLPHMIACEGGGYSINVGGQILFHEASPVDAVMLLLGCYFVFALPYPYEAGATLEFIQRYFLKINPAKGSKIAFKHGKKKTTSAHPKVLSLVCALNAYESSCP